MAQPMLSYIILIPAFHPLYIVHKLDEELRTINKAIVQLLAYMELKLSPDLIDDLFWCNVIRGGGELF